MPSRSRDRAAKAIGVLLISFVVSVPSHAVPLTYFVNFSGVGTMPEVGLFTYDAATSAFSNFLVSWDGTIFDLTSSANAPFVGGACPGTVSSPATGFALMSKTLCGGLYDRWFANGDLISSSFSFSSQTLALPEVNAARISDSGPGDPGNVFGTSGVGDWTLSAPIAAIGGTPIILPGGTVVFPGGAVFLEGIGLLPVNYLINFTGVGTLPALGLFNYDAANSVFSNFFVSWDGNLFDLTSSANAPFVGGACPGTVSSPATGFALMSKALCGGLYDGWFANADLISSSFSFSSQTLALPEMNAARISDSGPGDPGNVFGTSGVGDWSLTRIAGPSEPPGPAEVPEPKTGALILLALALALLFQPAAWRKIV